jgi:hypothetical protein
MDLPHDGDFSFWAIIASPFQEHPRFDLSSQPLAQSLSDSFSPTSCSFEPIVHCGFLLCCSCGSTAHLNLHVFEGSTLEFEPMEKLFSSSIFSFSFLACGG